jgi:hypothetical protein
MIESFFGIQVISVLFALFMIYMVRLHYKRGNIGLKEFISWLFCWLLFILFALLPQLLNPLINKLRIIRVLDLLMMAAFMILTYLAFSDHMAVRDIYRQMGKLVSEQAKNKAKQI